MLDRPVIWGQLEPKRELTGFSSRGPAVSPSALTAPSPQIHTTRPPSTLYILHMFSWTGLARPPGTQCRCSPLPGRSPLLWTLEVFLCRSSPRGLSLQTKGGGTVTCTSKYLSYTPSSPTSFLGCHSNQVQGSSPQPSHFTFPIQLIIKFLCFYLQKPLLI